MCLIFQILIFLVTRRRTRLSKQSQNYLVNIAGQAVEHAPLLDVCVYTGYSRGICWFLNGKRWWGGGSFWRCQETQGKVYLINRNATCQLKSKEDIGVSDIQPCYTDSRLKMCNINVFKCWSWTQQYIKKKHVLVIK